MRFHDLRFFIVLSLLVIPGLLQSKLFSQSVMVGVKGGLSFPQLKGGNSPQSEGYTSRSAATFGGFINYELSSRFTLQGEVLFSGQGGKRNGMQPIFSENLSGLPVPADINLHADFQNETVINLTSGEFAVLKSLVTHPRQPLSRDKLMNLARGRDYSALERSIDVQVSRLRRLLEIDPAKPRYIQTVWGVGYVFVPDGDS